MAECGSLVTNQDLSDTKVSTDFIKLWTGSGNYSEYNPWLLVQQRTITGINQDADAAISEYKLKNKGVYLDGPTLLEDGFEYVNHTDGKSYFAINPPYTTDPVTFPDPSTDSNLISQSYITKSTAQGIVQNISGLIFHNVADLKSGSISPDSYSMTSGQQALTSGYFLPGDGGNSTYLIKTAAEAATDGDVIDEFGNVTLSNGNVAIIQPINNIVNAAQFGLVGDGSDELDELLALHAFAINRGVDIKLGHNLNYGMLSTVTNLGIPLTDSVEIDFNQSRITSLNDGNGEGGLLLKIYDISKGGSAAPTIKLKKGALRAPQNFDELSQAFPPYDDLTDINTGLDWNIGILYDVGDVNLILEDFDLLGYWFGGITGSTGSTGNVTTSLKDCRIEALTVPWSGASFGTRFIFLEIDNCKMIGHANQGPDWSQRGRVVYPQPHMNVKLTESLLQGGGRTQFNHFSSSMNMDDVEAGTTQAPDEIVTIDNCVFKATEGLSNGSIFTNNLGQLTHATNCIFDGTKGIEARSPVKMTDCHAINEGALYAPHSTNSKYPEFDTAIIQGGSCGIPEAALSSIQTEFIDAGSIGMKNNLVVNGVVFDGGTINHTGDYKVTFEGCTLNATDPISSKIHVITSEFAFNGCKFGGQHENHTSTSNLEVVGSYNSCEFDYAAWGSIDLNVNPITGEDVTINDGTNSVNFNYGTNVTLGATVEESARNLVEAINDSILDMKAIARGDSSLYVYQETIDISVALPAILENSTNITVDGMKTSNPFGFNMKGKKVSGGGNSFKNGAEPRTADGVAQLGLGNGANVDQRLATATLYLNSGASVTEVTGASNVSTIRFDRSIDTHKLFNGQTIRLISIGGFNLTDSGNITLIGASPTNYPIGTVAELMWIDSVQKWVEQ